jgi:hypothetical protein
MPSDMSAGSPEEIDEERRLLNIAMTRAKRHLHLIHPIRFYRGQQLKRGDARMFAALSFPQGHRVVPSFGDIRGHWRTRVFRTPSGHRKMIARLSGRAMLQASEVWELIGCGDPQPS